MSDKATSEAPLEGLIKLITVAAFLKCYDIFSDVHDNRKSCRVPAVSLSHAIKIIPCKSALRK